MGGLVDMMRFGCGFVEFGDFGFRDLGLGCEIVRYSCVLLGWLVCLNDYGFFDFVVWVVCYDIGCWVLWLTGRLGLLLLVFVGLLVLGLVVWG